MMKIYGSNFRKIAGTTFVIKKIYPSYRQAFNPTTKQMETFVQKDGKWFKKTWEGGSAVLNEGTPDFKFHKKVYDVELELAQPKTFKVKDKEETSNVIGTTLSAWLIGEIMKATVAFGQDIPQNNGRDAFDWEEKYLDKLVGEYIVFAVSGEGIGTKYTFKSSQPFAKGDEDQSDKELEAILGGNEEIDELF